MSTPPYIEVTFDPPLSSDSNDNFDSKAFDTIGKLNPWGGEANDLADWVGTKADQALAAAIGGDLPELTDKGGEFLRVKADESAAEFVDISTVVPSQSTADWEAGTSTDEGVVSPAKVKAAINDQLADATAGLSYGAVGTYVFAGSYSSTKYEEGSTYAGSTLKPAGVGVTSNTMSDGATSDGYPTGGGSVLSGTWRAMGRSSAGSGDDTRVTLFLRVS